MVRRKNAVVGHLVFDLIERNIPKRTLVGLYQPDSFYVPSAIAPAEHKVNVREFTGIIWGHETSKGRPVTADRNGLELCANINLMEVRQTALLDRERVHERLVDRDGRNCSSDNLVRASVVSGRLTVEVSCDDHGRAVRCLGVGTPEDQ